MPVAVVSDLLLRAWTVYARDTQYAAVRTALLANGVDVLIQPAADAETFALECRNYQRERGTPTGHGLATNDDGTVTVTFFR